ncbi:MAG: Sec-independent protein translocase protein TatAy [Candidatus Heimdallarchaeota archaeon LC_3]|nr:MAG: Sec-independent protein translocase protein TatAy [Candidatus Heimdallarchaeota archaeon LC_3]
MNIGPLEIGFVVGLAILLFGPDKLPQLARSFGKATKEYQKAIKGVTGSGTDLISDVKEKSSSKFDSIGSLSEDEQIIENATSLGIETEGKTINQLIEEILEKTNT